MVSQSEEVFGLLDLRSHTKLMRCYAEDRLELTDETLLARVEECDQVGVNLVVKRRRHAVRRTVVRLRRGVLDDR